MKEYYNKYKNRVEFLGIDCNDTEEKWKNAISLYNLDWKHVINNENIKEDVTVMYGIKKYPTKIILNKERKILAKFTSETGEFYEKLDELLKSR